MGVIHPAMTNEPPPEFIRSPFLYIPYLPPEHNLPFPDGCGGGGGCHPQRHNSGPFNYVEQNGYLKILIICVCRPPISFDC